MSDTIKVYSEGSVFWDGTEYKPDADGVIELPELAVRHIESHGYAPANVFHKPVHADGDVHKFERVGPKPRDPLPAIDENDQQNSGGEETPKPKKAKAGSSS